MSRKVVKFSKVGRWFRFQTFYPRFGVCFLLTTLPIPLTMETYITMPESIQNVNVTVENDEGLGHMTDKPLKKGRKYVDSGFVHDVMDTLTADHYLVRAHVWSSLKA